MRDADRAIGLLRQRGNQPLWLVVNRVRSDWVKRRTMYAPKVIAQTLDVPLAGVLQEDEEVLRCQFARKTVIESDAKIWQTMDEILRRLLGEKVPFDDIAETETKRGFGARLLGKKQEK